MSRERDHHFSREFLENPINLANIRHVASLDISKNPNRSSYYSKSGILSKQEIELILKFDNFILPSPYIPLQTSRNVKEIDPHLRDWKIEFLINTHTRPCFFIDGVFDVFTVAHLKLVMETSKLARESKPNPGVVFVTIQPDEYVEENKGRETIFSETIRAGWFRDLPVDWVTIWPTVSKQNRSWEVGLEYLRGWPSDIDPSVFLNFVFSDFTSDKITLKEAGAIIKRERQVRAKGFGVIHVDSHISDISTTKLINRFNLKPVRYSTE